MVDKTPTPTPAAPMTPEPPKCCPICGETKVDAKRKTQKWFVCGELYILKQGEWLPPDDEEYQCGNSRAAAVGLRAERDAALAQVKMFSDNEGGALTFHILRTWEREKLERFCLHLLGDDWQTLKARAEKAEGERDAALYGVEMSRLSIKELSEQLDQARAEVNSWFDAVMPNTVEKLTSVAGIITQLNNYCAGLRADRSVLTARLAELQAVVDAAKEWKKQLDSQRGTTEWFAAEEKLIAAVAALESGAESEVTK